MDRIPNIGLLFSFQRPSFTVRIELPRFEPWPPRGLEDDRAGSSRGAVCTSSAPCCQEGVLQKTPPPFRPKVPVIYTGPSFPSSWPGSLSLAGLLRGGLLLSPLRAPRQESGPVARSVCLRGARYVAPPRKAVKKSLNFAAFPAGSPSRRARFVAATRFGVKGVSRRATNRWPRSHDATAPQRFPRADPATPPAAPAPPARSARGAPAPPRSRR